MCKVWPGVVTEVCRWIGLNAQWWHLWHELRRKCTFYVTFPSNILCLWDFLHVCPAGSVYRDEFDLAILKMQEDNRLEILKRKWWDGGKCPKEEDHRAKGLSSLIPVSPILTWSHILSSPGLGMENIGGIFVVLVCGLLVAILMAVLEFVWMLRQTPGNEVRQGYLTCICFVSLSPPWHPPPRGATRLSSFQLWQEKLRCLLLSSLREIISTKPKMYLTYTSEYIYIFFPIYSNRNCIDNTHSVVSLTVVLFKINRFLLGASNKFTDRVNRVNVCLLSFRGFPTKLSSVACMTSIKINNQIRAHSLHQRVKFFSLNHRQQIHRCET